jgi:hypothetical protein
MMNHCVERHFTVTNVGVFTPKGQARHVIGIDSDRYAQIGNFFVADDPVNLLSIFTLIEDNFQVLVLQKLPLLPFERI